MAVYVQKQSVKEGALADPVWPQTLATPEAESYDHRRVALVVFVFFKAATLHEMSAHKSCTNVNRERSVVVCLSERISFPFFDHSSQETELRHFLFLHTYSSC
jgi:hypothetical protein